jgi:membrane-associated phospholipid phosphatase
MRMSEWVSFVYFAAMSAIALVRPLPMARRAGISAIGMAMCAAIVWLARTAADGVRSSAPLAVILVAYYLSGRFALRPSPRFERWLLSSDQWMFGNPATRFASWSRLLLAVLEILYVGCFLLVPAGYVALLAVAADAPLVDRYWTIVLAAELGSFFSLAFVHARPPWVLEQRAALPDRAVHRMATRFVEHFTIRANTFPSGHAAGSLAVALGTIGVLPMAGLLALLVALGICVAAVVGRYHYAVDVLAGVVLVLVIFVALG